MVHLLVTHTPSASQLPSPSEFLGGCGRGRYRDRVTQKCRGRPTLEGKQLVPTGSGERRLSPRWLAENKRESERHAQAKLADGTAVD